MSEDETQRFSLEQILGRDWSYKPVKDDLGLYKHGFYEKPLSLRGEIIEGQKYSVVDLYGTKQQYLGRGEMYVLKDKTVALVYETFGDEGREETTRILGKDGSTLLDLCTISLGSYGYSGEIFLRTEDEYAKTGIKYSHLMVSKKPFESMYERVFKHYDKDGKLIRTEKSDSKWAYDRTSSL
jgi:hypothetical protein